MLLSRTTLGKHLIFVGDKRSTIKALSSVIQATTQWTEHMQNVLMLASANGFSTERCLCVHRDHPFAFADTPLPQCNTGFVCMIISIKQNTVTCIGQTLKLGTRLTQHNSGYGSSSTTPEHLRPWALFAHVCGFNNNRQTMQCFEHQW